MKIIIVGGPKRGKSTYCRDLELPIFCTDPRSLCPEPETGVTYLSERFAAKGMWSASSQFIADDWFNMAGPWCVEGVATARALRKWRGSALLCDKIVVFRHAYPSAVVSKGQEAMAKGVMKVWSEIQHRFTDIVEYI